MCIILIGYDFIYIWHFLAELIIVSKKWCDSTQFDHDPIYNHRDLSTSTEVIFDAPFDSLENEYNYLFV